MKYGMVAKLLYMAALVSIFYGAAPVRCQTTKAGQGQMHLVLDKDWSQKDKSDEMKAYQALRKGDRPVTESDRQIIDHGAQWYAYRLTHTEYHRPKPSGRTLQDITKEAMDQIADPAKAPRQQQVFIEEFGKRFVARLAEVTKNPRPAARLNAAMLLAKLAATGVEDATDVLAQIIADPTESDGVKLWAFVGLRDFFGRGVTEASGAFTNKDREARCIAALLAYVESKPSLPADASQEEIDAMNYVRAEAVAALGQTRFPAITKQVDKNTRKLERTTGLALLKILRKDGAATPPTLGQQVAAAVGLCRLQSRLLQNYNADYAAYNLGRFVSEFVNQYRQRGQEKRTPWKGYALRVLRALEELKNEDRTDKVTSDYIQNLTAQAMPLLSEIVAGRQEDPIQGKLDSWLDQNPPKNTTLFKGMPESVVAGKPGD